MPKQPHSETGRRSPKASTERPLIGLANLVLARPYVAHSIEADQIVCLVSERKKTNRWPDRSPNRWHSCGSVDLAVDLIV